MGFFVFLFYNFDCFHGIYVEMNILCDDSGPVVLVNMCQETLELNDAAGFKLAC